jgi:sugar/nucleoside kinase (ribokinase family)
MVDHISPDILDPVLNRCDWISCNEREAAALTAQLDPAIACRELAERVSRGAIVRRAERGCVIATHGRDPQLITPFAVEVLDANGAGDTHFGTFLAGIAGGLEPPDAARRANAAAAISVSRRGHANAPTAEEVRVFVAHADSRSEERAR